MKTKISQNLKGYEDEKINISTQKKKRIIEKEICSGSLRKFDNLKNKEKPEIIH